MGKKHKKPKMRVAVLPILMKKYDAKKKPEKKRKIFLVTSRDQGQWIIPTGKLEKKKSNRRVAQLEAFEEAGVIGKLDEKFKLCVLLESPCGKKKRKTIVFLLHVKEILTHWPEKHERRRKAINLIKYANKVSDKKLKHKLLRL